MKSFHEILTLINEEEDEAQQIALLKFHIGEERFRDFFAEFYSPESKIRIPDVEWPHLPNFGLQGALRRATRTFYIFRQPWAVGEERLKNIFVQMLEGLDHKDAQMLSYFSRKGVLPFRRITNELITKALGWEFPTDKPAEPPVTPEAEKVVINAEPTPVANTAPVAPPAAETPVAPATPEAPKAPETPKGKPGPKPKAKE
jgi:hypothetical protein